MCAPINQPPTSTLLLLLHIHGQSGALIILASYVYSYTIFLSLVHRTLHLDHVCEYVCACAHVSIFSSVA